LKSGQVKLADLFKENAKRELFEEIMPQEYWQEKMTEFEYLGLITIDKSDKDWNIKTAICTCEADMTFDEVVRARQKAIKDKDVASVDEIREGGLVFVNDEELNRVFNEIKDGRRGTDGKHSILVNAINENGEKISISMIAEHIIGFYADVMRYIGCEQEAALSRAGFDSSSVGW